MFEANDVCRRQYELYERPEASPDIYASWRHVVGKLSPQPSITSICVSPQQGNDARSWWASNAVNYRATATLASQYSSVPATSAQSERQFSRQFSAAGRLISKLRAWLDGDRVDSLIFLYKNM